MTDTDLAQSILNLVGAASDDALYRVGRALDAVRHDLQAEATDAESAVILDLACNVILGLNCLVSAEIVRRHERGDAT